MEPLALANTGRSTTRLGYGCSSLMGATSRRESLMLLEAAFDAGIRHFDVAPMYGFGAAENCLGDFLQHHKGQVTVTTKFGIPPARNQWLLQTARAFVKPLLRLAPAMKAKLAETANSVARTSIRSPFTAAMASESLDRSLQELRVDYIDILLLHEATAADLVDDRLLEMLQRAQESGKIGTFGVGSAAENIPALLQNKQGYCHVLQFEWSALNPRIKGSSTFRIHHRSLAENLRILYGALTTDPHTCAYWSQMVGANLERKEVLGDLMLKAALDQNPHSIILFSSKNAARIHANVCVAEDESLTAPAFRLCETLQREGVP